MDETVPAHARARIALTVTQSQVSAHAQSAGKEQPVTKVSARTKRSSRPR